MSQPGVCLIRMNMLRAISTCECVLNVRLRRKAVQHIHSDCVPAADKADFLDGIRRTPSVSSSAATTCGCRPGKGLGAPKPHTYVIYVRMTATTLHMVIQLAALFRCLQVSETMAAREYCSTDISLNPHIVSASSVVVQGTSKVS